MLRENSAGFRFSIPTKFKGNDFKKTKLAKPTLLNWLANTFTKTVSCEFLWHLGTESILNRVEPTWFTVNIEGLLVKFPVQRLTLLKTARKPSPLKLGLDAKNFNVVVLPPMKAIPEFELALSQTGLPLGWYCH